MMTIDRSIWKSYVDVDFRNSYPCPRCTKGRVRRGNNQVTLLEPHHSEQDYDNNYQDVNCIKMSFTTMLVCDRASCGEVVAVSGCAGVEENWDHGYDGVPEGIIHNTWLKPVSMFPAPPLFPITKNLPKKVKFELKLAFQLFWADRSASTSRLRTSLERVLDDRGVITSATDKNGNYKRLTLFDRIDLFEKASKDVDIVESMTAMRIVGNLGAHGDEVAEDDYFNLLDVYEDALAEIYDQKTATLKAKKAALIALKK